MEVQRTPLEKLIAEIDRPLWRQAAYDRLGELQSCHGRDMKHLVERTRERDQLAQKLESETKRADAREAEMEAALLEKAELREEVAHLKADLNGRLSMTVARLGGTVEGLPTGKHNFLQRVDELRRIELQIGEITAHRDRLRAMLNDVRWMVFNFADQPELVAHILRRIDPVDGEAAEKQVDKPHNYADTHRPGDHEET